MAEKKCRALARMCGVSDVFLDGSSCYYLIFTSFSSYFSSPDLYFMCLLFIFFLSFISIDSSHSHPSCHSEEIDEEIGEFGKSSVVREGTE